MSPSAADALDQGWEQLTRGDAAAESGDADAADAAYRTALALFEGIAGPDTDEANAAFGRAEATRRLGDLGQRTGDLEQARDRYAQSLPILAELMPRNPGEIKARISYALLQVARLDALAGRPDAEQTFRAALQVSDGASEADVEVRTTIWHYVGAYCGRRDLRIAAFLAHQESLEQLPADAPTERMLPPMRQQIVQLAALDEIPGALALIRLLERQNALSDEETQLASSQEVVDQLGLAPEERAALLDLLDQPANLVALHRDIVERMRTAVPDFARRFVADELALEATREAALPPAGGVA